MIYIYNNILKQFHRRNFTIFLFTCVLLSGCNTTTHTKTQKQVEATKKEIIIMREQTKAVKQTTQNTKDKIKELNTLYPECKVNNEFIETQIELIDRQTDLMENTLFDTIKQIEKLENISLNEIKSCESEKSKIKTQLYLTLMLMIIFIILEIKRSK